MYYGARAFYVFYHYPSSREAHTSMAKIEGHLPMHVILTFGTIAIVLE